MREVISFPLQFPSVDWVLQVWRTPSGGGCVASELAGKPNALNTDEVELFAAPVLASKCRVQRYSGADEVPRFACLFLCVVVLLPTSLVFEEHFILRPFAPDLLRFRCLLVVSRLLVLLHTRQQTFLTAGVVRAHARVQVSLSEVRLLSTRARPMPQRVLSFESPARAHEDAVLDTAARYDLRAPSLAFFFFFWFPM